MTRLVTLGLGILAAGLALVAAFAITSLVLIVAGDPAGEVWGEILSWPESRNLTNIINNATVLYLSALAVAIGFRMNLFNIGVDGQYRVAAFTAAVVAGEAWLPGYLNTALAILAAMAVGAVWAGIAGLLRASRGVSEVISTIMLNFIATSLVAYLLRKAAVDAEGSNAVNTKPVPEGSRIGGFSIGDGPGEVYGFVFIAAAAGFLFWFVLNRTRFGFDLRATGRSTTAAVANGINVNKMVLATMCLSGAVAGLVGLPILFGSQFSYGSTFQSGLGFAGIAIALLGRNHPVGIALGALLFAFLDEQSNPLQILVGVSPDIVAITQGVIVLTVVISYELIRRYAVRLEQQRVARALAPSAPTPPPTSGPSGEAEEVKA
ncbi:ABC transporter permease [Nocardioides sp. SYSU D00038]|uniref:ABC transporter permease n=1 Tax=Nocardioides sp. SYSU D00038 TaxID=2812554 RepID=UPI001967508A|nr:ABC transporter permease [Nocardioides sp. SYSU D00038]